MEISAALHYSSLPSHFHFPPSPFLYIPHHPSPSSLLTPHLPYPLTPQHHPKLHFFFHLVALAGPTGAGKSSVFNALVGSAVSPTSVRRPTTGVAHAAIFGGASSAGLGGLLDWLGVAQRYQVTDPAPELSGLVLIDLPDFDSTERAHRDEVDRLIDRVDLIIWVTDPQKYADQSLHEGYLRPLASYHSVTRFVLNKVDTVAATGEASIAQLLLDVRSRLIDDGYVDPAVIATAATMGQGLDHLRGVLAEAVAARRAMVDRIEADLAGAAARLGTLVGPIGRVSRGARRQLVERLGRAAGVDRAASVVAEQYRRHARRELGWPPMRLLRRWRPPLADLPRAALNPAGVAEVTEAVRDVAESIDAPAPWSKAVRTTAMASIPVVTEELSGVTVRRSRELSAPSKWWGPIRSIQSALIGIAIAGGLWLLVVAVLGGFLQLDVEPLLIETPRVPSIPLPSAMVIGGVVLSLLVAIVVRVPVAVAAGRRRRRFKSELRPHIEAVAERTVLADLDAVIADHDSIVHALSTT